MTAGASREAEALLDESLRLTRAGLHAQNEELLRDAVERFPTDAELLFRLAVATCQQDRCGSKERLSQAIHLAPDDPGILTRGASLMFALGDIETARRWTERARTRATDEFPLLIPLIHLIGKLAEHQGSYEAAEEALTIAFRKEPETVDHGRVLARFYVRRGRLRDALRVVERALAEHQDDPWLGSLRGDLESRLSS